MPVYISVYIVTLEFTVLATIAKFYILTVTKIYNWNFQINKITVTEQYFLHKILNLEPKWQS